MFLLVGKLLLKCFCVDICYVCDSVYVITVSEMKCCFYAVIAMQSCGNRIEIVL